MTENDNTLIIRTIPLQCSQYQRPITKTSNGIEPVKIMTADSQKVNKDDKDCQDFTDNNCDFFTGTISNTSGIFVVGSDGQLTLLL